MAIVRKLTHIHQPKGSTVKLHLLRGCCRIVSQGAHYKRLQYNKQMISPAPFMAGREIAQNSLGALAP